MTETVSELVERLRSVGAERMRAEPFDDPKQYMRVYARISREDGALMTDAATAIASAEARIAELTEALRGMLPENCDLGQDPAGHRRPGFERCERARDLVYPNREVGKLGA